MDRLVIDVEVCLRANSTFDHDKIINTVIKSLNSMDQLLLDEPIELEKLSNDLIHEHVFSIICSSKQIKVFFFILKKIKK